MRRRVSVVMTLIVSHAAICLPGYPARAGSTLYVGELSQSGNLLNSSIVSFDTTATIPTPALFVSLPGGTDESAPYALAFDTAGILYVLSFGGAIEKFTPNGVGSYFATIPGFQGSSIPTGLAIDTAGNVYASFFSGTAGSYSTTIEKFTPGGVGSVFAVLPPGVGDSDLVVDSAGNVYASSGSTIEKFTPNGVGSVFASNTDGHSFQSLAIDTAGDVYAITTYTATGLSIEEFTPGGVGSLFTSGIAPGVNGLAVDSADNLYMADGSAIEKFIPGGLSSLYSLDTSGSTLSLAIGPAPAPEPSSLVLGSLAIVMLGLFACVRHRFGCLAA